MRIRKPSQVQDREKEEVWDCPYPIPPSGEVIILNPLKE